MVADKTSLILSSDYRYPDLYWTQIKVARISMVEDYLVERKENYRGRGGRPFRPPRIFYTERLPPSREEMSSNPPVLALFSVFP